MPPKNMISVTRKSHMPREAAFFCCSMLAKWWRSAGFCAPAFWTAVVVLSLNGDLQLLGCNFVVVVGFPGHHRGLLKIESRGRRSSLPFQSGGGPGIVVGDG